MPDRLRRHYWIYRIEGDHLVYKAVVILLFAVWAVLMIKAVGDAMDPAEPSLATKSQLKDSLWLIVYASPLAVTAAVMAAFRRFKVGLEFRLMEVVPLVGCCLFAVIGVMWIYLMKK